MKTSAPGRSKRALQRYVESPLSVKLLQGEFTKGDHVLVDAEEDELVFSHYAESAQVDKEDSPAVGEGQRRAKSCNRK